MADISDVENALVSLIAGVLFPTGYQVGSPTASLLGGSPVVRLYPGWPNSADLDADLLNGISHVTVFPDKGMARNTTRYEWQWKAAPIVPATLTATVSRQTVTFGGTASASQCAGIQLYGNAPAGYRCLAGDTPSTVAAALAALLPYASPTVSGPVITFPSSVRQIVARTGADSSATVETRRQDQPFRVTIWTPTPSLRAQIAAAIDPALAYTRAISLPDGSVTNAPIYFGMYEDDVPQTEHEWRRDLKYRIEYATTYTITATQLLFPYANVNGSANNPLIDDPTVINVDYAIYTEDGSAQLGTSTDIPYTLENDPD